MASPSSPKLLQPSKAYLDQAKAGSARAFSSSGERTSMHDIMVQQTQRKTVVLSKSKYFLQRLVLVVVLTLATPFLNDFLSLAKSGEGHAEGHDAHVRLVLAGRHGRALSVGRSGGSGSREEAAEACEHLLREAEEAEAAAAEELEEAEEELEEEEREDKEEEAAAEELEAKEARRVAFLDQLVGFVVVLVLVVATISFEYSKELIEESMDKYKAVLSEVWAQLTVLGFLALATFLMVQSQFLQYVSGAIYGEEEHLVELFEKIHFAMFFVMVQFLVLALWLLAAAGAMRDQWESYDNLVIMLVQATKASNAHGSKGATAASAEDASTDMASGFELCETLYEHAVAAAPRTFCAHLAGLLCLSPAAWALPQAKERCVFQRIRQRFMWKANPASPLPNDYDFSDYLLECIRTFLAHTMHIPISIWVKSIFVMMGVFFAMGLNEERRIFWQALVGWLMYAQGALMCAHYDWVLVQLTPVRSIGAEKEELAKYQKEPTLWSVLHGWLLQPPPWMPQWLSGCCGLKSTSTEHGASATPPSSPLHRSPPSSPHHRRLSDSQRDHIDISVPHGGLYAGAYERTILSPAHAANGRTKQTALLFPGHSAPHHEGRGGKRSTVSAADMQHAAAQPLQSWLQVNLLLSALFLTLLVLFHEPHPDHFVLVEGWDWRVALAVYPILNLMIFQVPDLLPSMMLALSIEMLTQQPVVQTVLETMKLVRFARTAKLLQAMRSQAAALERVTSGEADDAQEVTVGHRTGATDFHSLLDALAPEQRVRAVQLKECFDVFDQTGEGLLDADELEALFAVAGIPLEPHQRAQMMKVIDADGSGDISFIEFAEYMIFSQANDLPPEEAAEKIFDMIDKDGDGTLDTDEIRAAFERMHTGLSLNELTQTINVFDSDNSGRVSREEFVEAIKKIFEEYKM